MTLEPILRDGFFTADAQLVLMTMTALIQKMSRQSTYFHDLQVKSFVSDSFPLAQPTYYPEISEITNLSFFEQALCITNLR